MFAVRRWQPYLESLDSRILPAVTLNSGVLAIVATEQSDVIDVRLLATDTTKLAVSLNNQTHTFNVADVTSLNIDARGGNDVVTVGADVAVNATVKGGQGNDHLTVLGTKSNVVLAGAGNDRVVGGIGVDIVVGGNGNDNIQGGAGADFLFGGNGNDLIDGGADADFIFGRNGSDTLLGGLGADVIVGGNSSDTIDGGEGDDALFGQNAKDTIIGGAGADFIQGGNGNDELFGDAGLDKIFGGNGPDLLFGGDDNDFLDGGNSKDTITGGAGFDVAAKVDKNDNVSSVFKVDKELKVTLTGAAGSGLATLDFDVETFDTEVEFNLAVSGLIAQANTTVDVFVAGVLIGQIALDASGNGTLILSSDPDEADESLLPVNFPETLAAGATIEVKTAAAVVLLQGSFQVQ
jgi:Ca2+-binding RTX toxin-like protein